METKDARPTPRVTWLGIAGYTLFLFGLWFCMVYVTAKTWAFAAGCG